MEGGGGKEGGGDVEGGGGMKVMKMWREVEAKKVM